MLHCSLYMKSNLVTCSLSQFSLNTSYIHPLGVPQSRVAFLALYFFSNNLSSYIHHSKFLKFADTECFLHINTLSDYSALQEDVTALLTWSRDSDLDFNLKIFVRLSFKCKLDTAYTTSDTCVPHFDYHKDLGLIL